MLPGICFIILYLLQLFCLLLFCLMKKLKALIVVHDTPLTSSYVVQCTYMRKTIIRTYLVLSIS